MNARLTKRTLAWGAALLVVACTESPPAGPNRVRSAVTAAADVGTPDPTLLPVANKQPPNDAAYNALNVPGQPAGFSYNDPVSGVKIWKVTSSGVPVSNTGAGHDYADGPSQVSRGWGPDNNTHTILIRGDGMPYYLVDFTRGQGFSNYRVVNGLALRDLAFTFSNVVGQERVGYGIDRNTGLLHRYNTQANTVEDLPPFPRALNTATPWSNTWLHQDKDDRWFVGLWDDATAFAWNSETNTLLTHSETWLNEPRFERDGRYVGLTGGGLGPFRIWDLSNNTFTPVQTNIVGEGHIYFSHLASARSLWVSVNNDNSAPFDENRLEVSGSQVVKTSIFANSAIGTDEHHAGNWIQTDAELGGNLDKQWVIVDGNGTASWTPQLAWNQAVGVERADGSDQRILLHHYSTNINYWDFPFGSPSPDGKVVIFNSNMNSSGRYDLFVAEMPLSGSSPPPPSTQDVVWTTLTDATANGNSITKTAGCEGCPAGAVSSQTISLGDGYAQFQFSSDTAHDGAGLSNGSTDNTLDDIDFAIAVQGSAYAEVRENGVYKADVPLSSTDVLRVEIVNGVVQYQKNGTVFYTSTKSPTYPLLLDTWLGTLNQGISNAVLAGLLN